MRMFIYIAILYLLFIHVSFVKLHSLTLPWYFLQKKSGNRGSVLNGDVTMCPVTVSSTCTLFNWFLLFRIKLSFFLLARSNFDHYARECDFGILKNKTKKKKKKKKNKKKRSALNSSVVWELTRKTIPVRGKKSSSGHHCMSGIYNIGHFLYLINLKF